MVVMTSLEWSWKTKEVPELHLLTGNTESLGYVSAQSNAADKIIVVHNENNQQITYAEKSTVTLFEF